MRLVAFRRACPPYNAGEVAGFEDAEAARLVARGTAAFHVDPAEAGTTAEPEAATPEAPVHDPAADLPVGERAAADEPTAEAGTTAERRRRTR